MESRLAARKNRRARKETCDYVTVRAAAGAHPNIERILALAAELEIERGLEEEAADYRRMKNLRPDYTAEVPMPVPSPVVRAVELEQHLGRFGDLFKQSPDDSSDAPKLLALSCLVPDPDLAIYLEGVRQGGTLLTAQVPAEEAIPSGDIVVDKDVNLGFVANDP